MQVTRNNTGMEADVCLATDKEGYGFCVVVVKGSFDTDAAGKMTLAQQQKSLVYADEHYGDAQDAATRYESDFAMEKSLTDVLVVGKAVSPSGQPTRSLRVRLVVQGRVKNAVVFGERQWDRGRFGLIPSEPALFTEMPLTFNRSFGGTDDSLGQERAVVESRNLAGVGFYPNRTKGDIVGQPLPNIERSGQLIAGSRDQPKPIGFGCIGRSWTPRVEFAGTYDQQWLETVCPFLPRDFDLRHYQMAPEDQQFPYFRGGEYIRCINMSRDSVVSYHIPTLAMPCHFRFADRTIAIDGRLDTVILEPHEHRAMLTWRASVRLGNKWNMLREIWIGESSVSGIEEPLGYVNGKPRFGNLGAAVRWLKANPRSR